MPGKTTRPKESEYFKEEKRIIAFLTKKYRRYLGLHLVSEDLGGIYLPLSGKWAIYCVTGMNDICMVGYSNYIGVHCDSGKIYDLGRWGE